MFSETRQRLAASNNLIRIEEWEMGSVGMATKDFEKGIYNIIRCASERE